MISIFWNKFPHSFHNKPPVVATSFSVAQVDHNVAPFDVVEFPFPPVDLADVSLDNVDLVIVPLDAVELSVDPVNAVVLCVYRCIKLDLTYFSSPAPKMPCIILP